MNELRVLKAIAEGRAKLEQQNPHRIRSAHVSKRRGEELIAEMASIGAYFGLPFDGVVPHTREDGEWVYLGIVLSDVHVFARTDGP